MKIPLPGGWVVVASTRFNISHPYMAIAPGCPLTPHPWRWCACRVFRTQRAAIAYAEEQLEGGRP